MFFSQPTINILLADDDRDDTSLFQDVLNEIPVTTELTIAYNGDQLMQLLHERQAQLPDMLFMDLNMPRKQGLECLAEIKRNEKFKQVAVIIYSTSEDPKILNQLYNNGACYFIRKPNDFSTLKDLILQAIMLIMEKGTSQPPREEFILSQPAFKNETR